MLRNATATLLSVALLATVALAAAASPPSSPELPAYSLAAAPEPFLAEASTAGPQAEPRVEASAPALAPAVTEPAEPSGEPGPGGENVGSPFPALVFETAMGPPGCIEGFSCTGNSGGQCGFPAHGECDRTSYCCACY